MQIRSLKNSTLEEIVACLVVSFTDYFVPMPADPEIWRKRFEGARVNFELSFGMFDQDRLVAFIIHGIDTFAGELTAFNTGTGVMPAYRNQKIVDQLYAHAFPHLKKTGISTCRLEVIQENARAIRVYKRIGFEIEIDIPIAIDIDIDIIKNRRCFRGKIPTSSEKPAIEKVSLSEIESLAKHTDAYYSWDNCLAAIRKLEPNYHCYKLEQVKSAFFIINPQNGYLAQFEPGAGNLETLFSAISQICQELKIINVHGSRKNIIQGLVDLGLDNYINQYEMKMDIS